MAYDTLHTLADFGLYVEEHSEAGLVVVPLASVSNDEVVRRAVSWARQHRRMIHDEVRCFRAEHPATEVFQ